VQIRLILILFISILAGQAKALGPHEVLLLVNEESKDSIEIANEYAKLRSIPETNVVRLHLPVETALTSITREDFTSLIWEPATKAMQSRGIEDHILVWVYSTAFPTAVNFEPQLSIQGLTFLRNRLPDPDKTMKGRYISPFFCGPDGPDGNPFSSQSFDVCRGWMGDDMPVPSMMLGCVGERGNTSDTVQKCLRKGAGSDGTRPAGTVFFVTSDDIRSQCRAWQYPRAVRDLKALDVNAVITNSFPDGGQKIIGLLCGQMNVNPEEGENIFLPGSMAEHLTSAAGIFPSSDQTKLSAWIKAGATASAGTVTEPYCLWTKFPAARFYVHYALGCTMIESYFQSIRCPLQILLVGDPLASPWAPKGDVLLTGLEKDTVSGSVKVSAEVRSPQKQAYRKFMFLVDGRVSGHDRILQLDASTLTKGSHTVRAVAYSTGVLRSQLFCEKKIIVR